MKPNAALAGASRLRMLHAITGEHINAPVVATQGQRDDDFAFTGNDGRNDVVRNLEGLRGTAHEAVDVFEC